MGADPHKPLREDVRLLGDLLGETLKAREGTDFFDRVEQVRALAKAHHEGDADAFARLSELLRELPLNAAVPIARAFSHFLTLANIAEQHHRVRRRREYARDPSRHPQPGSCEEAFPRLVAGGAGTAELADLIASLRIELVLTAHPTEIARRTLLQAFNRIAALLGRRDRADLTAAERDDALQALRREVAIVWETDEVRARAVTPLDEVRGGLAVFEQSLWHAVPEYLRSIDRALHVTTGRSLPLDAAPIRFGSWIGGDRDGNPNVTPDVTRRSVWIARWIAADLYLRDVDALREQLSISAATDELRARSRGSPEPYRTVLREVAQRLRATRQYAAGQIEGLDNAPDDDAVYLDVADFREPLALCHRSLVESGNGLIASGLLADVLRRVAAFGLPLVRLDIRQESGRHAEAVDWIARTRSLGSYSDETEDGRVALLLRGLGQAVPPLGPESLASAPDTVRDVLETFRTAAAIHPDSLGAYVITMAHHASDVLAVEFLQHVAGTRHPQRVVPLFETSDDLARAPSVVDALLAMPWYRERTGGRVEVMVGYSDSAKDVGRCAAGWALYQAQERIVDVCTRHAVELTLFHGRGGSIGRGGGPTYLAIQSQPPGSIRGSLRVTEQGEMIQVKFGLPDIAVRTLEVYTTAVLDAMLAPRGNPDPGWRTAMDRVAGEARTAYRGVVYDDPRFLDYFHTATPEAELRMVRIGSRPARRGGGAGDNVQGLRAIPWQFAWTQTRLLLASWLGIDEALRRAIDRGDLEMLRAMYDGWPFFRSTIDLFEMVLAKSDARIAAEYDRRLVPGALQPLGDDMRVRLRTATSAVLAVTRHATPVESNPVLRRSIDLRNPYVDPINLVQIELLVRLRQSPESPELARAFGVTVNGIAAGMRNTG